ncbi:probable mediator of RNA polymerase II transcription subunit 37e [Papaver somniferum]|uniref:probable mediator of RNA polymerase II transcription subunit 37e n=1 Tax=Papaver somniferum TaxID=3469 RepID=UPI000E7033C7|nr:probable mediator of RNA polymerase II transcription subunit 37e [Papaver somniferum]
MQFFFDGEEFCNSIKPDEAVAYGAVLSGAGQALVGCHSSASWCRDNNRGVMDTLIPRNTTIPIKIEKVFSTYRDKSVEILCANNKKISLILSNSGYVFYGVAHQHFMKRMDVSYALLYRIMDMETKHAVKMAT